MLPIKTILHPTAMLLMLGSLQQRQTFAEQFER